MEAADGQEEEEVEEDCSVQADDDEKELHFGHNLGQVDAT